MPKKHKPSTPVTVPALEENVINVTEFHLHMPVGGERQLVVVAEVGDETDPGNYKRVRRVSASVRDIDGALDDYLHKNASNQSTVLDNLLKSLFALLEAEGQISTGTLED